MRTPLQLGAYYASTVNNIVFGLSKHLLICDPRWAGCQQYTSRTPESQASHAWTLSDPMSKLHCLF